MSIPMPIIPTLKSMKKENRELPCFHQSPVRERKIQTKAAVGIREIKTFAVVDKIIFPCRVPKLCFVSISKTIRPMVKAPEFAKARPVTPRYVSFNHNERPTSIITVISAVEKGIL